MLCKLNNGESWMLNRISFRELKLSEVLSEWSIKGNTHLNRKRKVERVRASSANVSVDKGEKKSDT